MITLACEQVPLWTAHTTHKPAMTALPRGFAALTMSNLRMWSTSEPQAVRRLATNRQSGQRQTILLVKTEPVGAGEVNKPWINLLDSNSYLFQEKFATGQKGQLGNIGKAGHCTKTAIFYKEKF